MNQFRILIFKKIEKVFKIKDKRILNSLLEDIGGLNSIVNKVPFLIPFMAYRTTGGYMYNNKEAYSYANVFRLEKNIHMTCRSTGNVDISAILLTKGYTKRAFTDKKDIFNKKGLKPIDFAKIDRF